MHLFAKCVNTENLWTALQSWLGSTCQLPNLDPQNALLGFPMSKSDLSLLTNHILLIFKRSLYEARGRNIRPNIHFIKARIMQTERIEFFIAKQNNKLDLHCKKWDRVREVDIVASLPLGCGVGELPPRGEAGCWLDLWPLVHMFLWNKQTKKRFSLSEKFVGEMCEFCAGGDWYKVPPDGGLASRVSAICFGDSGIWYA